MSCALQRVCARANIGTSNSGVPTYRIRSRQLFRIHKLRFGTVSGATGAVCGDINAVTCCMNLSGKSSLHRWQNQCPLSQQPVDTPMLGTCRTLSICSPYFGMVIPGEKRRSGSDRGDPCSRHPERFGKLPPSWGLPAGGHPALR